MQKNIISGNDDATNNILFPLTAISSDVSKPNQLKQDMNLSNDNTKSLSLNETLDANQSIVSTSSTSDCSQSEEVLATTLFLSSETDCSQSAEDIVFPHPNPDSIKSDHSLNTDPECSLSSSIQLTEEDDVCSQPADSCQLNIHLPRLSEADLFSNDTIHVQNMDLPQSISEIDLNNSTVESLEHDSISLPNQIPDIDISVIATSTPKPLSKILQEVSIRCKKKAKRTTQLFDIQINSSHSDTLGSLSIQNEITQKDSKLSTLKHVPISEDLSNQDKQLCLEPEPDFHFTQHLKIVFGQ